MDATNIRIEVETNYLEDQSEPAQERFVFAYTISIFNGAAQAYQLLSRHWVITDGAGSVEEVRGEGVLGQQPRIAPNQMYSYTSGAILKTPVGSMRGAYEFVDDHGGRFSVPIEVFSMSVPNMVH